MKTKKNYMYLLYKIIFNSDSITGKLLVFLSPILILLQAETTIGLWERLINIGVAVAVLGIGIYLLWKKYNKQDAYEKDQTQKIIEIVDRTATLNESVTRALENSTKATENSTRTMEKVLEHMERVIRKLNNIG